jgi:hypothetical protein
MALKKIGYDAVDWINRAQDMVHGSTNTVMNHRIPQKARNFFAT